MAEEKESSKEPKFKVTVSHDGQLSVDPNDLIQTRQAREHLKALSKFVITRTRPIPAKAKQGSQGSGQNG